jgi:hypothetical protein
VHSRRPPPCFPLSARVRWAARQVGSSPATKQKRTCCCFSRGVFRKGEKVSPNQRFEREVVEAHHSQCGFFFSRVTAGPTHRRLVHVHPSLLPTRTLPPLPIPWLARLSGACQVFPPCQGPWSHPAPACVCESQPPAHACSADAMALTSDELNLLVYRYLQESGAFGPSKARSPTTHGSAGA